MKKVLLIHQDKVPHYRIPVFNWLSECLEVSGYKLFVVSSGVDKSNPHPVLFNFKKIKLRCRQLFSEIREVGPDAIISRVNLKNMYLFPVLLFARSHKIKIVYWGHGVDLQKKSNFIKNCCRNFNSG